MKIKNKIKIIEILFIISLIINIISIRSTYAKYNQLVETSYQIDVRKWFIIVNQKDIQDETNLMSDILQPTYIKNEYIRDGILAPGREGYFELGIDYTKIDVPFTYSFEMHQINEEAKLLQDLEFKGYTVEYPVLQENFLFRISSEDDKILYIQKENDEITGEIIETVLTEGVDPINLTEPIEEDIEKNVQEEIDTENSEVSETIIKVLEIIEEMEDPDTAEPLGINKILTAMISLNNETNEKIIRIKEKSVNSETNEEIEPEQILFEISPETDEETSEITYTAINNIDPIKLEDYKRYQNIRLHFKWNDDDETSTMDNVADTAFRGEENSDANSLNTLLKYQATMKFKQYVPIRENDKNNEEIITP